MDETPQSIEFGDPIPPETPVTPYQWPEGKMIAVLTPTLGHPSVGYTMTVANLFERDKMRFKMMKSHFIVPARNKLAEWFLFQTNCEWSFWLDDDTALSWGDVAWFREEINNPQFPDQYAKLHPIGRLLSQGRRFIGACYFGRHPGARAQFADAFSSRMADDAAHIGPRDLIQETSWIGFGCVLIHRQVFLDIVRTQPEIEVKDPLKVRQLGFRYRFFNPTTLYGDHDDDTEDVAFCDRARAAGHSVFVDHAIVPSHEGRVGYSYHNTRRPPVMLP